MEGGGPEFETLWAFSADCGVSDLEAVIKANWLCNEYGLDTISAGATIACAMELNDRGLLADEELDGPPLEFGNAMDRRLASSGQDVLFQSVDRGGQVVKHFLQPA